MVDRSAGTARSIANTLYNISTFVTAILIVAGIGAAAWLALNANLLFFIYPPLLLLLAYMNNLTSKLSFALIWTMADISDDLNFVRKRFTETG